MFEIAFLIAVVMALAELVKRKEYLPTKYLPLFNLLLGLLASVFYVDGDLKYQIMMGIVIGLSASGLFDQTKILKGDK